MPAPIDETLAVASVTGAVASSIANRSSDTVKRRCLDGLCGSLVGIAVGPAASDAMGIANRHYEIAVSFAAGAIGLVLLTILLDWAKSGSFRQAIDRILGKVTPPVP